MWLQLSAYVKLKNYVAFCALRKKFPKLRCLLPRFTAESSWLFTHHAHTPIHSLTNKYHESVPLVIILVIQAFCILAGQRTT